MQNGKKLKSVLSTSSDIRLSGIIKESIVDGPGLRYVIFTQGCLKRCFMCHNQQTLPLDGGYLKKTDEIVLDFIKNPLLKGITLSGGEPFLQAKACLYLAQEAHKHNLNVVVYSGYTYEVLKASHDTAILALLKEADILIDGPYIHELRSYDLIFKGSSNQRMIDLKKTHEQNKVVII